MHQVIQGFDGWHQPTICFKKEPIKYHGSSLTYIPSRDVARVNTNTGTIWHKIPGEGGREMVSNSSMSCWKQYGC